MNSKLFVHIVTYNSAAFILKCVQSLLESQDLVVGSNLTISVTDNASSDETLKTIKDNFGNKVLIGENQFNLGFCAGHNQGVRQFLDGGYDFLLVLNPDLYLHKGALLHMLEALGADKDCGSATPRILRADENLEPVVPHRLDAAGMELSLGLRHFDRASEEQDTGQFSQNEYVFGGSGACLLMKRSFVEDLLLEGPFDADIARVYPELLADITQRSALFDESFFAYREDADLAWRAQNLGWKCLYVASAQAYHLRKVLPERRFSLPPQINLFGVRNRFLLQLNNYSFFAMPQAFLPGILWRNMLVIVAVLTVERSSAKALWQVLKLTRRALARRRLIKARVQARGGRFWSGLR